MVGQNLPFLGQAFAARIKAVDKDPLCKCGHTVSAHTGKRAEKRAHMEGTIVPDYPSGHEERFNIDVGRSDNDACSEIDCSCERFSFPSA